MDQYLQLILIWMSFPLAFFAESDVGGRKTSLHDFQKVEIELDIFGNEAQIVYNDTMRVKAKVAYMPKKKMVAYKDEKNGRCLLENIKNHANVMRIKNFENEEYYSRLYQISGTEVRTEKVKKIAGKKIIIFCEKLPMILLKEFIEIDKPVSESTQRVKRENYYEMRKNESVISTISHQMPKKLGKRQYPSASAKIGQSGGVDYHARIRNNLQPGTQRMHPIDITSSVTITTGSATPVWSYSSSAGSQYPASVRYQNDTKISSTAPSSHQFPMASNFFNVSHISRGSSAHSLVKPLYSTNVHPEEISYSPSLGQNFQLYHPPSARGKSHVAHQNVTSFSRKSSATDIGQNPVESKFYAPSYHAPSIYSRGSYAHNHLATFQPQHGYNQAYFPPSSSSKIHHSILHNQNISQHESRLSPGRSVSVYAQQVLPSETSETPPYNGVKYEKPHGHQIDAKRTFSHGSPTAHYPLSSVGQSYHLTHIDGHTNTQPTVQSITQYPPSSSSKIHPSANHFIPSGRPEILPTQIPVSELYYPRGTVAPNGVSERTSVKNDGGKSESYPSSYAKNIPYSAANIGSTSVSATPLDMGNSQSAFHQPSSENKMHYLPSSIGRDIHPGEHFHSFPPSSTSKLNYSPVHNIEIPSGTPTSHTIDELPPMQISSTPRTHYTATTESQTRAQISQPLSDRNFPEHFPLSSTSKTHQFSSHAHVVPIQHYPIQYYPPSASSKHQNNRYGVAHESLSQRQPDTAYYSPSSISKMQNFSYHPSPSDRHFYYPEFYPPSSTGKVYHVPASASGHDSYLGSRHSVPGKSLMTSAQDKYYPLPSSSKTLGHSKDSMLHSQSNDHVLQHPYYGASSSQQILKQSSHNQMIPGNIAPSSKGHALYSTTQYPSSAINKVQPVLHHNISGTGQRGAHDYNVKNLHPMLQHPSSLGSQYYWPAINSHNDTSSGGKAHTYNLPNGLYSQEAHSAQYPPSSSSSKHSQRNGQSLYQSGQGSDSTKTQIPCQISPRSTYSITTRTILTPNGLVQRPSAIKTNEESPCGEANVSESVSYNRHLPCYGSERYSQAVRDKVPCTLGRSGRNMRKSQRSIIASGSGLAPNMNISHFTSNQPDNTQSVTSLQSNNQHTEEFSDSEGVVITDVGKSQIELVDSISNAESNEKFQFSKLKAITSDTVNSTSQANKDMVSELSDQNEEVETFEGKKEENTHSKPVKYQKITPKVKNIDEAEEEVKEGDVLEPGDRILGRDGYTILDGFRGRVVSVTGQVGKMRAEIAKNNGITKTKSSTNNSNSAQFRYSSELGRYVKDNGNFSNCNGELTFTCTEFFGSNGRAKICKPNPRRNPDGSPC